MLNKRRLTQPAAESYLCGEESEWWRAADITLTLVTECGRTHWTTALLQSVRPRSVTSLSRGIFSPSDKVLLQIAIQSRRENTVSCMVGSGAIADTAQHAVFSLVCFSGRSFTFQLERGEYLFVFT